METLTITVNRNPNPPKFPTSFYNVTISDVFPLVTPIVQVYATDYLDGVLSLLLFFARAFYLRLKTVGPGFSITDLQN